MADIVLKPFQIRNLHFYPAEENLYDSSTESIVSNSPADDTQARPSSLIHLSAGEYDKIINDHPNGTLTYIDDDDGDIITVGSSFELEQRLDEPTPYTAVTSSNQTEPTPIHLFDIRRRRSIIKLWKDIEKRSELHWDFKAPEQTTTEFMDSSKPSEAGTSLHSRGLDSNESTDLRKRWLDACRPPRLQSQETEKEVPSPISQDVESSTPTIMSLSAITEEGRRQAEEAGSRIRGIWDLNNTAASQAAPDFIRNQPNPWAVLVEPVLESKSNSHTTESSTKLPSQASKLHEGPLPDSQSSSSKTEAESQPLLSAFEAEMAKILENAQGRVNEAGSSSTAQEPQTHRLGSVEPTWPVNLMTGILQTVAGGIENLGSELKTKIPEVERHLVNAQRAIPEDLGPKLQTALTVVESQIQNLTQIIQHASDASGEAAERVRQADLRATEEVLNGLGDMAHEFEDFGKTLFAAFEAEFGQQNSSSETNSTNATIAREGENIAQSQTREEKVAVVTRPLDQSTEAAAEAPLDTTSATAYQHTPPPPPAALLPSHLRESLLSEIRNSAVQNNQPRAVSPLQQQMPELSPNMRDSLLSEIRSRPTLRDSSPSEAGSSPIQTNQPQEAYPIEKHDNINPLFVNWPNRPAFVLPSKPAATQPPSVLTVTRPPVPPKTVNDKPTEFLCSLQDDTQPAVHSETKEPEQVDDTSKTLFMGNIGFEVTERVIEEVFSSQSFPTKVHLPIDSSTGKHAGFGYANFTSVSSAKAALARFQGVVIDGHSLNLELCDNSPIGDLQTQTPVNQSRLSNLYTSSAGGVGERRPPVTSGDNLPSVFSGNARSIMPHSNRPGYPHSSLTPQDHPEETPEFAARYPSLLPAFKSQEHPLTAPARSMTFSPSSEIARFPPISQIDAHLLAETSQSRTGPHRASTLPWEESRTKGEEHRRMREPRRVSSTINRRSLAQPPTQPDSAHALRRRATEANSLRHRTYGNPFREQRPVSLYDRPTGPIPGSFPADDTPMPATNNDEHNAGDRGFQYAMQQSLIDQCVDDLLSLGYGTVVDGGRDRLRIIAEAANSQVADAIDMIEEERTAYERYTPNA
ncbi:RNA binding protein, putative [Talaromyces stipitatus ATCC 10500]|uniref:RNA binding protein, putative n=1 Tax=Talaromyces stipitatus (strain ATCC 10500 / CBS 375.48 / QM 6759 / NRRL 1006) TaxID=441959 RepID=B8M775_TALSN|nr:RNA binding protein, putative [Talaromyces stipitatus ATCC 10500]EED20295.1 RNA binding protein, putative [Talaromyces stipitatus ATCC 10500]